MKWHPSDSMSIVKAAKGSAKHKDLNLLSLQNYLMTNKLKAMLALLKENIAIIYIIIFVSIIRCQKLVTLLYNTINLKILLKLVLSFTQISS